MLNLPKDYDSASAFDGGSSLPKLTIGGHICRIRNARLEKTQRSNKDMLVIAFDINEGGEFDGFYQKVFEVRRKYNADAKWSGIFRTTITNAEGNTNGFFKGLIEAVEASNNGYNFKASGCNELSLQGKFIGFNFGEEEYTVQATGEIKTSVKPMYAVSVAKVHEGVIPPAKKLANTSNGSNSYSAPQQTRMNYDQGVDVDDDELPF